MWMQNGIERSEGSERRGKESAVSRKGKRRRKKLSPIQNLFNTCKDVFADCGPNIVPSPEKIEKLAAVLDGITQADVGLRSNMPYFSSQRAPIISYMQLHECDKFSIGIFCLPPTSVIPLHNHPGMTVFSKLLFGTMHIKAYDWVNESADAGQPNGLSLAKLKTACAVLDVLGPPYGDRDGRHCQYYHEFPFSNFPVEGQAVAVGRGLEMEENAWLKEREKPQDSIVVAVPYHGPIISTQQ